MEVRPGYKQTEVGVIPEDWDVKPLSNVADVRTGPFGSSLHERDYVSDGTPIITVEHLSEQGVIHENLPLVSDTDWSRLSNYSLRSGDIVFSRVGSVDRNAVIRDSEDGWLFSGRLLRVRVHRGDAHPPYLSYHFHSESFKQRVRAVAVGQTMASLNTQILKGVYAVLPTGPEQRAIAAALSDVDALLGGLDRLIAKKRDLKRAVMQQLLTGQTRLPGFYSEWEDTKLGSCLLARPDYGINAPAVQYSDRLPTYIRISDISDDGRYRPEPRVSVEAVGAEQFFLRNGELVFARTGASVGKSYLYDELDGELVFAGFLIRVRPDPQKLVPSFLAAYVTMNAYWNWVRLMSMRSGQPGINGNEYAQIPLSLPDIAEQTAIADVLSDMDAELVALEARRDKTRDLKQAMMQELLTGKTRLIPEGGAHA